MSDNVDDKGPSVNPYNVNTEPYFWKDPSADEVDSSPFYWDACYNAIAHANMALEAIAKEGDSGTFNAQKGEALICRAYSHFMLVSLFAKTYNPNTAASDLGVPYVTEVEKVVSKKYTRETVAKVYEMVEKDMLEGLPLLHDDGYGVPKYHFTKNAGYAFASRYYLFKKDYKNVVKYADLVLGANTTSQLRDWKKYSSFNYYELMQAYTLSSESSILLMQEAFSIWGRRLQRYRYSLSSPKMGELYGDNVAAGSWYYAIYGSELTYGIPKFQEYFKKVSINANTGWPFNMVPLLTCEETFFNRLEALAKDGADIDRLLPALNDYLATRINQFDYQKNGITLSKLASFYKKGSDKENFMECLLYLKRIDFIHEGIRWFDILRNGIEVIHKTAEGQVLTLKAEDPRRVLQIPSKALNSGIPANPR
jgi:hypothetical protein